MDELRREWTPFDALVRSYAVTREARYLAYYYAIWRFARGQAGFEHGSASQLLGPRDCRHQLRFEPASRGLGYRCGRMVSLVSRGPELAALEAVLAESQAPKQIEQVRSPRPRALLIHLPRPFATAGRRHAVAMVLVFGRDYDLQHARVFRWPWWLCKRVDQRTGFRWKKPALATAKLDHRL